MGQVGHWRSGGRCSHGPNSRDLAVIDVGPPGFGPLPAALREAGVGDPVSGTCPRQVRQLLADSVQDEDRSAEFAGRMVRVETLPVNPDRRGVLLDGQAVSWT